MIFFINEVSDENIEISLLSKKSKDSNKVFVNLLFHDKTGANEDRTARIIESNDSWEISEILSRYFETPVMLPVTKVKDFDVILKPQNRIPFYDSENFMKDSSDKDRKNWFTVKYMVFEDKKFAERIFNAHCNLIFVVSKEDENGHSIKPVLSEETHKIPIMLRCQDYRIRVASAPWFYWSWIGSKYRDNPPQLFLERGSERICTYDLTTRRTLKGRYINTLKLVTDAKVVNKSTDNAASSATESTSSAGLNAQMKKFTKNDKPFDKGKGKRPVNKRNNYKNRNFKKQ